MRLPHCYVCKEEGDCSKGTMFCVKVEEGVSIYLCPSHYENREEIIAHYLKQREKRRK